MGGDSLVWGHGYFLLSLEDQYSLCCMKKMQFVTVDQEFEG